VRSRSLPNPGFLTTVEYKGWGATFVTDSNVPVDTVIKKGLTSFIVLEATSKSVWFFSASSKSRFTDAGGAGSSCAMYDEAMLSALPWLSSILTTARFSFLRLKITSVLKVYLISNKPSAYLQCLGRFRILLLPDP